MGRTALSIHTCRCPSKESWKLKMQQKVCKTFPKLPMLGRVEIKRQIVHLLSQ
jgi:hypothetical protein